MTSPAQKKGGPGVRVDVAAIKAAREVKGWSQAKLAYEIGSDKRVVERIESRGTAALKTITDIAEVCGVSPESLRPSAASPEPVAFSRGLFQLPPSLVDFTGREAELERIAARLQGVGGVVGVSSALRGMGGIGKTATAIEACWMVKDHFPDAQLLVELRGMSERPMTAVEAMARIIRDFHPEIGKLPDDETELLPHYRNVLTGKKALILLDNAKDEAQVKSLLSVSSPVAFVVTSRVALALDGVESIPLDVLPPDKALELLRKIIGPKGTDDELREVARLCGFLPLALRVAADFIRLHRNWTVPKYIDALKDEARRWEHLKGKTQDRDVEAVLALSVRELVLDNPERAERWQMLSVFPADFDVRAAAAVWDLKTDEKLDEITALDELTALLDRSLVQFDESTDRYSLHDLLRPIARDTFEFVENHPLQVGTAERIGTAERRFAGFYRYALIEADRLYQSGHEGVLTGLQLFDREEANIRYGQAWASRNRSYDRFATELCRDYPITGAHVIQLRLSVCEQIRWLEEAITACREIGDRWGEGAALGNLGVAYTDLGEARKAINFHEQALVISREIGDRRREGAALGNLGVAWANLCDNRKAINFHEQYLAISHEIGDRRGEGKALGNLGLAWADLGDASKAINFHEQYLVIAREIGDRRGEGNALGNLGLAWANLGDARKAINFHEQHLVIVREIGDRRGVGNALGNLGIAYKNLGDARKAINFHEQHLVIVREIGDRRGEGNALGNLGIAWARLGDARKAINFYEQRLVIAREIGDRRGEGGTLGNLGIAWVDLGDAHKAINFHEPALVISREIGDRQGEGTALMNLGNVLAKLGDARQAITFFELRLVITREIGDRRGEGETLGNLGNAWADLGDAHKAITFYEQSLAIKREIGDRRGEAISSFNMALALHKLGQTDEALRHAEHARNLFTQIESPHAENVRQQLAEWRGDANT